MALLSFDRIGITGVCVAVPKQKIVNSESAGFFTPEEIKAAIETTGIAERRIADAKTCASDLCHAAADALIEEMNFDRKEIDVLIFVSQTPDYRMPVTGTILQDRLGLEIHCDKIETTYFCPDLVRGYPGPVPLRQRIGV